MKSYEIVLRTDFIMSMKKLSLCGLFSWHRPWAHTLGLGHSTALSTILFPSLLLTEKLTNMIQELHNTTMGVGVKNICSLVSNFNNFLF